jgi:chromosomal replication initiation ATPase DnaA
VQQQRHLDASGVQNVRKLGSFFGSGRIRVENLLKNSVRAKKSISIPEIVKMISDYYHIPDVYIYNKTRRKDVVKPRQIVM